METVMTASVAVIHCGTVVLPYHRESACRYAMATEIAG